MRPSRSFILLFLFLAVFVSLRYLIPPGIIALPSLADFIPQLAKDTEKPLYQTQRDSTDISGPDYSSPHDDTDTLSGKVIAGKKEYTGLESYFDSLAERGEQIRVLYYGDSQLEGDRITSYLREYLRRRYGGNGPGLFLPVMPVMYTKTINLQSSSNWKRYNLLSYTADDLGHKALGPFMTVCRYLPPGKTAERPVKASIKIKPSVYSDSASAVYNNIRVFYGNVKGEVTIEVRGEEDILSGSDTLSMSYGVNELSFITGNSKEIEIVFEGKTSPDIYGISAESVTGVVVDNIPQRGSAGLEFTMVNRENLNDSYKLLDPDLIVIHFGLNVVKNVISDYSYYEDGLARQVRLIRELCPGKKLLVVSLNDMAYLEGDTAKSYSNIGLIRTAQQKAAEKEGALFWDSFGSMGGTGSIVRWASALIPLAQKDLVHLTYQGADTVAKMLADSIFRISLSVQSNQARSDSIISAEPPVGEITPVSYTSNQPSQFSVFVTRILSYNPDSPFIFTTPAFWLFFLVVMAGYSLVYTRLAIRSIYLLIASLFFYFKTGGLFILMLFFITVTDYTLGILIDRARKKGWSLFFLILSLSSNLLLLAYFKYAGFLAGLINDIAGTDIKVTDWLSQLSNLTLGTALDTSSIILPVGISFFIFQSLSYTIDIYRKRMKPVSNILDFGFYVSFFPHLVAGPIVRASVFIPQIYARYNLSKREFSHAVFLIVKGLAKKMIISNFIAINLVDRVFEAPAMFSGFENLMAVYGYGLQIYSDFSGYTDIAIGVALLMGFRLPLNFNSPYKASEITDFWKRWHISLSQWLKDYLYIPLGGNKKGKIRTSVNLMVTMLLGGLWHGASIRFVLWGAMHGMALVIHKVWRSITGKFRSNAVARLAGIIITFNFVNFCWIFFRAPDMESAGIMLTQIGMHFYPGNPGDVLLAYLPVLTVLFAGYFMHFLPENSRESYRALFIRMPLAVQIVAVMIFALFLWQIRGIEAMPFIYFRF